MRERFADEITDLPQQLADLERGLRRRQRNSTRSTRMVACLLCGGTDDLDTVRGLCRRRACNPHIPRWRSWNVDLQGQPPYYHPRAVPSCTEVPGYLRILSA